VEESFVLYALKVHSFYCKKGETVEITLEELKNKNACSEHLELFKRHFGESVKLTREVLIAAPSQGFNLDWLAENFLSEYQRAEYQRVTAPALAEYERVTAPALAEYERVTAPALAEYERVTAQALAEYERVEAQAWAEYKRVKAQALADILQLD
jgi:cell division septum initiation protein DivIVA